MRHYSAAAVTQGDSPVRILVHQCLVQPVSDGPADARKRRLVFGSFSLWGVGDGCQGVDTLEAITRCRNGPCSERAIVWLSSEMMMKRGHDVESAPSI